ncbi:MAG: Transcriptional repressor NrdR [Alphaproteobacteria bacterium MarineAlpha5_Bin2]|jgi:transcriptional repressor NrdR|nr:transcriptional regulator NrdR [Alphaproteobacteria bacterium]PPR53587.1 MAG: Transcriptional repressor NrdR [Alphaproteobacteria bacterium MarineAlpha5_Bin2]PPR56493.1 MAG: Transcriptional repressor NrdR [Alphaproteobacteria bacterium MarineAlpha5_Bin3]HIA60745.1 transcriptional repressor NrdR [Pelagibacterales bacterium]
MRCPFCSNQDSQVKDSRPTEDNTAIRRRRICDQCGSRFTTFERIQLRDLIVLKTNGKKEVFDRDKMFRSLSLALRKRNIDQEKIEKIVNAIVRKLENFGDTEVKSTLIGEYIMEALSHLDQIAYVRFASVYKNFREVKDFEDFLGNLEDNPADK